MRLFLLCVFLRFLCRSNVVQASVPSLLSWGSSFSWARNTLDVLCVLAPMKVSSSSSRSSDGNSSLLDEGGSASQVPQASLQLAGYRSVVWPGSLSEWLVGGAGLQ